MTERGSRPSIAKRWRSAGDVQMSARPLTLSVSPTPGIKKSSAIVGDISGSRIDPASYDAGLYERLKASLY